MSQIMNSWHFGEKGSQVHVIERNVNLVLNSRRRWFEPDGILSHLTFVDPKCKDFYLSRFSRGVTNISL